MKKRISKILPIKLKVNKKNIISKKQFNQTKLVISNCKKVKKPIKKHFKTKRSLVYKVQENFGIGVKKALYYNKTLGLNCRKFGSFLNKSKNIKLKELLSSQIINKELVKYYKDLDTKKSKLRDYKTVRNNAGLPCRGQRTKTNSKTKKKWRNKKISRKQTIF